MSHQHVRNPHPSTGFLPLDAQRRLQAASRIGAPGTKSRRIAIDQAYRYIEDTYPEYLKKEERL